MFIASYRNTMAGARPKQKTKSDVVVRTIEEIRAEKRARNSGAITQDQIEVRRRQANDLIKKGREAAARFRLSEIAVDPSIPIDVTSPITIREILEEVASKYGVTVKGIIGRSLSRRLMKPRHEAMWTLRKRRPDMSAIEIGRVFNRDHTTVLYAIKKHENAKNKS